MKKEIIKSVSATALCLGLFGAGFVTVNNISIASAIEGTQPLQFTQAEVVLPVANVTPIAYEEHQKPDMAMNVIFESSAVPSANALTYETAAEMGAQYIWDMFGKSLDGKTVIMTYSNPPSATRAFWMGRVVEADEVDFYDHASILFTFSIDAVTGERIDIFTAIHSVEPSEDVRAALVEFSNHSQGTSTVSPVNEMDMLIALRSGGLPPAQLDDYIYVAKGFAQRHFGTTEVVSAELRNINALAFDLDENGNLFATSRQLVFEVTDNTGRVADIAITEATRQLIWLLTSSNDIVPGFNYVGTEPGRG